MVKPLSLKDGVRVLGIRPEIVLAIMIMRDVYEAFGFPLTITSVVEGTHQRASLHYTGAAVDLRLPPERPVELLAVAKIALGDDFDVVLEADHLHVEWQPKAPC